MEVTEISFTEPAEGQSFIKANEKILEQMAIRTYIEVMNSNAAPDIKIAAAKAALASIGKEKPPVPVLPPTTTNNFQINAAIGGHVADALKGLGQMLERKSNAPQMLEAKDIE